MGEMCSYFWDYLEALSEKQSLDNPVLRKYNLPKFKRPAWALHYKRPSAAEAMPFELSRCLSHLVSYCTWLFLRGVASFVAVCSGADVRPFSQELRSD